MKKLPKAFVNHLKTTIIVYIIGYIFLTFIIWEFKNPFQWIINIPTEDASYRLGAVCLWVLYMFFTKGLSSIIKDFKKI